MTRRAAAVEPVATPSGPPVAGPYSAAVRAGDWVIVSGQIPIDRETGELVDGGIGVQVEQVLANLAAVLGDCGLGLEHLAKTTVYVTDLGEFPTVNDVYARVLGEHRPSRATVEVAALPLGARVEIEAWAFAPGR